MIDQVGDHILTNREKQVLSDCFWKAGTRGVIGGTVVGGLVAFAVKKLQRPQGSIARIALVALSFIGGVYGGSASTIPYCLKSFAKLEDSELGDTARRLIMAVNDDKKPLQEQNKQEYDWEEDEQQAIKKEKANQKKD